MNKEQLEQIKTQCPEQSLDIVEPEKKVEKKVSKTK